MPQFDRTYFEPTMLDLFWQMITERMRIYWRREAGTPPPWTLDPILRTEFITNVYRELDPGTQYLVHNILESEHESDEDKMFNIMIYRLMGSRMETHEAIGFQRLSDWDWEFFAQSLRAVQEAGGIPFGEAYRTAAYSQMGSPEKITNVALLLNQMVEGFEVMWTQMKNCVALPQVFEVLNAVDGFGEFLAHQILVDTLYPAPWHPLMPYDQDVWAMPGPGARRGIWQLMKKGMKPGSHLDVMVWLRDNQHQEFERLGLDFPFLENPYGDGILPISLCNIQSCLCEFYKYTRIWVGDTRGVRKYNYNEPLLADFNEPSVITVAPPGRMEGVGNVMVGAVGPDEAGGSEHLGLPGMSVPGSVQLEGVGSDHLDEDLTSPEAPADHTGKVIDTDVRDLASGASLHHGEVGLVPLQELHYRGRDDLDAFLQLLLARGGDRQMIEDVRAVLQGYRPGPGQADVKSNGYQAHVTVSSDRRIREMHIVFD